MKEDTVKAKTLVMLANIYTNIDPDKGVAYGNQALALCKKLKYKYGVFRSLGSLSFLYSITGEWAKGLEMAYHGIAELDGDLDPQWNVSFNNMLELAYEKQGDFKKCLRTALDNIQYIKVHAGIDFDPIEVWASYQTAGQMYNRLGKQDSALIYLNISLDHINKYAVSQQFPAYIYGYKGLVYAKLAKYDSAFHYMHKKISIMQSENNQFSYQEGLSELAHIYFEMPSPDSALKYATIAFNEASKINNPLVVRDASEILAKLYENKNITTAHFYLKKHQQLKDSLTTLDKTNQLYQVEKNELQKAESIAKERISSQARLNQNRLIGGLSTLALFTLALAYYNRQKQKSNKKLEKAYRDLQSAQAQLIHSEKMASLGELTAGIAHEIQNPLNFVNNFSDLNKEMLEEMKEELANSNTQLAIGNTQEAKNKLEDAMLIANDLMDNESKINHHGKRAESIVKGMLEHSRKSSGVKEPTNINKLCEEFVRLSYHGLRAKDKTFNCDYKLDFDPDLPLVKVISQDIGRVILNIVNNAFQATTERFKSGGDLKSPPDLANPYQPLIILTTKNLKDKIEISISDNGPGIPGTIKEKIFQPFFTTKPTGQGTGLGLSLAYDIVKAHGGTIEVDSKENEGTEFIIKLPLA
jgi:signal transduction histidine kinase